MDTISPTIFRAYDIRGQYKKEIDQKVFYQIGQSVGTYMEEHLNGTTITVGNDIRKTSESLSYAYISGVTSTGINVINTGTSSFGQTLFYGCQQNHDLISFITASHLPADWNGIKFYYGDGVGLPENELRKIRDITLQQQKKSASWETIGTIQTIHPKQIYKDFFSKRFRITKPLKVAVDCGGGSMVLSAPEIFQTVGLEVVPIFCDADPLFSVRPSDPKPEHLSLLSQTVHEQNCDFGVAFDGDGDRAVIVDDTGTILSADQTGIIIGTYGLDQQQGTIIVNVECSKSIEEQLTPLGFNIKQIQVGHTFLTLHAKQEKAPLGIESSGHLIIPSYYLFDDALLIPLKIAEILEKESASLSSLCEKIPMYPRKKVEIDCSDTIKFDVIDALTISFKKEYTQVNTLDGIRIELPYGWALIRASNTSPIIRLTVEADTEDQIQKMITLFQQKTKDCIRSFNK